MARVQIQKSIMGRSLGFSVSGALVLNLLDNNQIVLDPTGLTLTDPAGNSTHIGGGNTAAWGQLSGTITDQSDLVSTFTRQANPNHSGTGTGTLAMPATWTMAADPAQADNSHKVATTAYADTLGATKAFGGTVLTSVATAVTLSQTHNGNVLVITNANPITVTLNTGLAAGFSCTLVQGGAGIITVSGGSATQTNNPANATSGQGTSLTILPYATDSYYLLSPINGVTINSQSGASYTLVASDAGGLVDMTNAGVNTLNIPDNSSVPFPVSTVIAVRQGGTGTTTIATPGSDTKIKPATRSYSISAQYEYAMLRKLTTTSWEVLAS